MSIATKTGDNGMTSLLYGGRVMKNHPRIVAVGDLDELNSAIGVAKAIMLFEDREELELIQKDLVNIMGEIACFDANKYFESKFDKLKEIDIRKLDARIHQIEEKNLKFSGWATPGNNGQSAAFDMARSVCRRAERSVIAVDLMQANARQVRHTIIQYINRLSDYLWLLAREAETI